MADTSELEPIRSRDDLVLPMVAACKPPGRWLIGPEMEKFGVLADTRGPLPYAGPRSVLSVLQGLVATGGWRPEREYDGGPIIALEGGGESSITLEPGGQLELSGAPVQDVHQVFAQVRQHMRELADLAELSAAGGIRWLGLGFHPFARREDFEWVPKQRYAVMRRYLPTRGGRALDMMLRTCTVQVNVDYASEADAMRKMRVAMALTPAVTAMFSNSPWVEGHATGALSERSRVWLDVDPDRTGLVRALWSRAARFDDYVEWALDVPMFLFKRSGGPVLNTGQTFRQFWKDGFMGHVATRDDWSLHLNTLFPDVRLKNTIELRGADMQGSELVCAVPALWTGILYDERALSEAESLVQGWGFDEVMHLRGHVYGAGLRTSFRGKSLATVAEQLVAIAEGGLARRGRVDPETGLDERVHLAPLRPLTESARTPAEVLLERVAQRGGDTGEAILRQSELIA